MKRAFSFERYKCPKIYTSVPSEIAYEDFVKILHSEHASTSETSDTSSLPNLKGLLQTKLHTRWVVCKFQDLPSDVCDKSLLENVPLRKLESYKIVQKWTFGRTSDGYCVQTMEFNIRNKITARFVYTSLLCIRQNLPISPDIGGRRGRRRLI